ncbi:MAG: type IV pilus assembly protein PilA [Clostridium sp.]|jgi:type IV pilus assembly protein PilA
MLKDNKRKKGFTLIELIIVISIIGIIMAISVPKFSTIQRNARIKADIASAKVIADATNALICEDNITKSTYSTATVLGTDISDYIQSIPNVKAVEGEFFVRINSTNDNVEVFVNTDVIPVVSDMLYPTPAGFYAPAAAH